MAKTAGTGLISRRRAPVGAPPGTLIADQAASPTGIVLTVISEKGVETREATLVEVEAALAAGKRLWVAVTGLSDIAALSRIANLFSIDLLALEDIVNTGQRPKADSFGDSALVVVQTFDGVSVRSREQLSIFFDKRNVVTFQEHPGKGLDPVLKRLAAPAGLTRKRGAAYLVYAMLDTVLDGYFPLLEKIGDALEELEDSITDDPRPGLIHRLHALKRELLTVKRALWPARELLSAMTRDDFRMVPREVDQFLRDLHDHAVQLIDIVETDRELCNGLLDLYLSGVSTRLNEVMKVLTIVSTIFIPLSFLAGVWGMNFDPAASPWNMPELGAYYGYPAALAVMALVGFGLLAYFRWKRWL